MKIEMDSEHRYMADGLPCVSVTTILQKLGFVDFSKVPPEILEYASLRGKYTHMAIELYLQGKLNEKTLDTAIQPYFQGFKKFASEHELKPLHLEKMFAIKHLLLAGTIDFIGEVDGVKRICDWKCVQKIRKASHLQLGGYRYLHNANIKEPGEEVGRGLIVQLLSTGGYKIMEEDFDAEDEFRTLLLSYHIKKKYLE